MKKQKKYQDYKKLFESFKKWSKKFYFSKLMLKYKNNIKKLGKSFKEQYEKKYANNKIFPKRS